MATSRSSSLTRLLLRAAVSHRTNTLLLSPRHNLHRNHHSFTPISQLSFLRSHHPFNHRISNPHLFSTSRSVHTRATKSKLMSTVASSCTSFLGGIASTLIQGVVSSCANICALCAFLVICYKFVQSLDGKMGTKFEGSLPDMFRKGHSVVVKGTFKLIKQDNMIRGFNYLFSATEVLTNPDQLAAAMERNHHILVNNLNAEKQSGATFFRLLRGTTPPIDEISNDIADPVKFKSCPDWLVLEGRVNQSVVFSLIAKMLIACLLRDGLVDFEGLTDALREGHSVVVDRSVKPVRREIKEGDKSGKSVAVKLWGYERHISAKVLPKHDKYMPHDASAAAAIAE